MEVFPKDIILLILNELEYKDKRKLLRTSKLNLSLLPIVMKYVKYGLYEFNNICDNQFVSNILAVCDDINHCRYIIDKLNYSHRDLYYYNIKNIINIIYNSWSKWFGY